MKERKTLGLVALALIAFSALVMVVVVCVIAPIHSHYFRQEQLKTYLQAQKTSETIEEVNRAIERVRKSYKENKLP